MAATDYCPRGLLGGKHGLGQTAGSKQLADFYSLRERAERGDIRAQAELGFMYEFGVGAVQRDYIEALKWYRKAAEQGDSEGKQRIAGMYFDGKGVTKDYAEAARWYGCPKPSIPALTSCKAITSQELPEEALDLLASLKCDAINYDYGSAVDLNGDGQPEYQICCKEAQHGPCSAVVIGKVGSRWMQLTKEAVFGYDNACGLFIVLDSLHSGFNDVCLPNQCSASSSADGKSCTPTIWHFVQGRYRSLEYTPITPPK